MSSGAAVPAELERDAQRKLSVLRNEVLKHRSSWAALCICLSERPETLHSLLGTVGVVTHQAGPFDACADAYSVYEDACTRGKLKR